MRTWNRYARYIVGHTLNITVRTSYCTKYTTPSQEMAIWCICSDVTTKVKGQPRSCCTRSCGSRGQKTKHGKLGGKHPCEWTLDTRKLDISVCYLFIKALNVSMEEPELNLTCFYIVLSYFSSFILTSVALFKLLFNSRSLQRMFHKTTHATTVTLTNSKILPNPICGRCTHEISGS